MEVNVQTAKMQMPSKGKGITTTKDTWNKFKMYP